MLRKPLTLLAGFVCLLTSLQTCRASTLYGIDLSSNSRLFGISQVDGTIAGMGNTGNGSTGDLASNLASILWSVDMAHHALLSIDPSTGAVSRTTPITTASGAPVAIVSLAWDPVMRFLYGNTTIGFGNLTPDQLYRIDPATGLATLAGNIGVTGVFALGFDNSGILYGISPSQLVTIDTATGAGALVSGVPLASIFDLAFRPEDNALFVADSGTNALYTMNPVTGAVTLVGTYGSSTNVVGLAFLGTPEPGTIGLSLAGLGFLVWKVRRASTRPLT